MSKEERFPKYVYTCLKAQKFPTSTLLVSRFRAICTLSLQRPSIVNSGIVSDNYSETYLQHINVSISYLDVQHVGLRNVM